MTRPPVPVRGDSDTPVPGGLADPNAAVNTPAPPPPAKKAVKLTPAQVRAKQLAARKPKTAKGPAYVVPTSSRIFDGSVYAIATATDTVLAATSVGLLTSQDNGVTWVATGPEDSPDWRYLAAAKKYVVAASLHGVVVSSDRGVTWQPYPLPEILTQVAAVAVEPNGNVWVGGREGVFVSSTEGKTWEIPKGLALNAINNIFYDDTTNRMTITTSGNASLVFTVLLPQRLVNFTDTGWTLRFARPMGDHIIAATLFDGIVVQPRMVATPLAPLAPAQAAITEPVGAAQARQD
jgi:hypothetical protein